MNIKKLQKNKELISEKVHDSWMNEKTEQGFHAPLSCKSVAALQCNAFILKCYDFYEKPKFVKFCDKCHADMYPYNELPENIKDYDRVTVQAVIDAISSI